MNKNILLIMAILALGGFGVATGQNTNSQSSHQTVTDEPIKLQPAEIAQRIKSSTSFQQDKMVGKIFETTFEVADVSGDLWVVSPYYLGCRLEFRATKIRALRQAAEALNKGDSITVRGSFSSLNTVPSGYINVPDSYEADFKLTDILKVEKKTKN